ncbi:rhomboid family intramembrane serine protease [Hymenobacter sp. BT730]|uniref:rhomboid family intramembrane serine protease n=1 Tax=Hymenobacter sp. BT730 TaxID=3063332 RepID=UPI0026DFA3C4|nr:rhomboid family intramembrane serine protease [Hymenobacter sp. BT730]
MPVLIGVATSTNTNKYLTTSLGKLSSMHSMEELPRHEPTRYYAVRNCWVDRLHASYYSTSSISGKHNDRLNFDLYVSTPLFSTAADTALSPVVAWLGTTYHEQISARSSEDEKEAAYRSFIQRAEKEYNDPQLVNFLYLTRASNSTEFDGYQASARLSPYFHRKTTVQPLILLPEFTPFEQRSGKSFQWIFLWLAIGSLGFSFMLIFPSLHLEAEQVYGQKRGRQQSLPQHDDDLKSLLGFLKPGPGHWATSFLLLANLLVFVWMLFSGVGPFSIQPAELINWGGIYGPAIEKGQLWRIITAGFVHAGVMHLINNLATLGLLGYLLEEKMGFKWLTLVYFLALVGASYTSLWWHPNTVSVGASGAIFGLTGLCISLVLRPQVQEEFRGGLLIAGILFSGISLLLGFVLPGVDNAAHLGGLTTGLLAGLVFYPLFKHKITEHPTRRMHQSKPQYVRD